MEDKKLELDIVLDKIAKSLGGKVVTWNTVNEAIEKNISFIKITDTSKYITEEENKRIKEKSYIGNNL